MLAFSLPEPAAVKCEVYTEAYVLVRKWDAGYFQAGPHRIIWDQDDQAGQAVPNGIYFIELRADFATKSRHAIKASAVFR